MTKSEDMWENTRRRRGSACVSDLQIDQAMIGELTPDARHVFLAHLSVCSPCEQAHARLLAYRQGFETDAPLANLAAHVLLQAAQGSPRVQGKAWWRRLLPAATMAAGLAAAAFVLIPKSADQGARTKGGFSMSLFVQGADGVGVPHAGQALHPRDRVRLQVASAEAGYLTVLGIDERKQVSVYFPAGPQAAAVPAGAADLLPTAIELDESLGREVVVAVRCPTPIAVADVQAAARRAVDTWDVGKLPTLPLPCAQVRYLIAKVAPTLTP